jgi:hypothetical protein
MFLLFKGFLKGFENNKFMGMFLIVTQIYIIV